MPYKLIRGRSFAQEAGRLLDQEIIDATTGLTHASAVDSLRLLHATRKHLKKARALLTMARRPLGDRYFQADDELRTANRALGPLVDAHRVLETIAAARREGVVKLPATTFAALRLRLDAQAKTLEQAAIVDHVRPRIVRLLKSLRLELATAGLAGLDRATIVAEIREAHAVTRKARRRAIKRPSVAAFHQWRRRLKREWHLFRLVAEVTGDRLLDERHQLAALDDCLGALHDVDVLIGALAVDRRLSRIELARVLVALRAHRHGLRRLAHRLSSVLDERPQQLARRVLMLWGSAPRQRAVAMVPAWPRSA